MFRLFSAMLPACGLLLGACASTPKLVDYPYLVVGTPRPMEDGLVVPLSRALQPCDVDGADTTDESRSGEGPCGPAMPIRLAQPQSWEHGPGAPDTSKEIHRLQRLRSLGVLTRKEFEVKKAALLRDAATRPRIRLVRADERGFRAVYDFEIGAKGEAVVPWKVVADAVIDARERPESPVSCGRIQAPSPDPILCVTWGRPTRGGQEIALLIKADDNPLLEAALRKRERELRAERAQAEAEAQARLEAEERERIRLKEAKARAEAQHQDMIAEELRAGRCNRDRLRQVQEHLRFVSSLMKSRSSGPGSEYLDLAAFKYGVARPEGERLALDARLSGAYEVYVVGFDPVELSVHDGSGTEVLIRSAYETAVAGGGYADSRLVQHVGRGSITLSVKGKGCVLLMAFRQL